MSKKYVIPNQTAFERLQEQEYFVRRENVSPDDYEQAYWGTVTDPDGVVRNRSEEREKFLASVQTELSIIDHQPAGRLLDIGCGLGFLLSGIDSEWERHGVEISKFAAKHASQWGEIFVGELREAAYPSNHFDVIILHHVIEHVPDPAALIIEARRILSEDGLLIVGTPDFDSGCARRFGQNYRMLHDKTHISLFSEESLRRFLRDHGFRIEHADYPYFNTPYFTRENLARMEDIAQVSPPFYGNFMTFYCRRQTSDELRQALASFQKSLAKVTDDETS